MCEILCVVMGCHSTKHKNSISDQVSSQQAVGESNDESGSAVDHEQTNGEYTSMSNQNAVKQQHVTFPAHKGIRPYSQSQLDFFEMLDKKIDSGRDYCSREDLSHINR